MSFAQIVWRQFRKNTGGLIGLGIVMFFVILAVGAPFFAPYDPIKTNYDRLIEPPSRENLLGTDLMGRDLLSRIIWGSRVSLTVGFVSIGIGLAGGMLLGLSAAFYPRLDNVIMRFIDILLAFPQILLTIAVVAMLGPSLPNAMIAVGIGNISGYARVIRGSALSVKETSYVEAARSIGVSDGRIMFRHMLPNMMAPILVMTTFGLAASVLAAAGLSFLGLGAQPPNPEWGLMINEGRAYMRSAWWLVVGPGVFISIFILGFNLLGDGLRDALDPQLRR